MNIRSTRAGSSRPSTAPGAQPRRGVRRRQGRRGRVQPERRRDRHGDRHRARAVGRDALRRRHVPDRQRLDRAQQPRVRSARPTAPSRPGFDPNLDGNVAALAVAGGRVFAGGAFRSRARDHPQPDRRRAARRHARPGVQPEPQPGRLLAARLGLEALRRRQLHDRQRHDGTPPPRGVRHDDRRRRRDVPPEPRRGRPRAGARRLDALRRRRLRVTSTARRATASRRSTRRPGSSTGLQPER